MQEKNLMVAFPVGLAASGVMTVVMLLTPLVGLPEINIPRLLANWMGTSLSMGMLTYFLLGVGLSVFFATIFSRWLVAPAWLQGLLFGVVLWLFFMVMGSPLIGWGLFASNTGSPGGTLITSLLGHFSFGATLGFAYEKTGMRVWSM